MGVSVQSPDGPSSDRSILPEGYGIAFVAGILLASFLYGFYHAGVDGGGSGRLIYHGYIIFFGTYSGFWRFSAAVLLVPLLTVNLGIYWLFHNIRTVGEWWFFLLLATLINGVVIFTALTVLTIYFI